ncbi:mannosyltransferase family protein [Conexibacter woesei]|uniref:mannosyltransferase family protein n=1 Tax=Conexibacter woesei TaxID=191495 RepID=UPI0002F89A15|nr:mannosyltransferase family protein [Conexibacter woesei]
MDREGNGSIGEAWRAFWTSRVAVWAAGLLGVLWLGQAPGAETFDPTGVTRPFSRFADLLLAPAARWDAVWYLSIADDGYSSAADHAKAAFYPLYPLLAKVVGWLFGSALLGGLVVSLACFFGALVLLHKLARIELGERDARTTILLVAFFPSAFFFSAVYAESLFLLLSVGTLLAARQGRWAAAGAVGALAALTRNSGVILLLPVLLLFLYGPRADREAAGGGPWWKPRYAITPQILWLALIPLGLVAFLVYIGIVLGDPFAPFSAQELWGRHLVPLGGIWDGARAAWLGLRQIVHGESTPVYFGEAGGDPFSVAGQNLMLFGFLVFALVALVGALRRLPLAYGAYALVALVTTLSYPVDAQPLMSLPRFVLVLFPLQMWLARWLGERGDRGSERAIAISAVLLGLMTAQFARWGFVA